MATYCWPQRTLTGLAGGWGATALAASLRITTGAKLVDYSGRVAGRQVLSFVKLTAFLLYRVSKRNASQEKEGN